MQSRRGFFRVVREGAEVVAGAAIASTFMEKLVASERKFKAAQKVKETMDVGAAMIRNSSMCTGFPPDDDIFYTTQCYTERIIGSIPPEDSPFYNVQTRESPRKWWK
jgi:hypothetical protein